MFRTARRAPSTIGMTLVLAMALIVPLHGLMADQLELKPEDRPVPSVNALANLLPGQEARIEYESHGCFHSVDRVFTFRRTTSGVEVDIGANPAQEEADDGQRTLSLSADDIVGLDQELDYHRAPVPGIRCTTSNQFDLVVRERGRDLSKDHFVDTSCSQPPRGRQGTTLWALSERGRRVKPADLGLQSDRSVPRR
jgi:hypothetical protein